MRVEGRSRGPIYGDATPGGAQSGRHDDNLYGDDLSEAAAPR